MRFRYLCVAVIFGTWVASLFWGHSPQPDWSMNAEVGSLLAAIVCTLVALFSGKWRAFGVFLLLLVVLIVGSCASFAYRLNNVCEIGERMIRSGADAISRAKARTFEAHYIGHGVPGYVDEKPASIDYDHTENCCKATRTRTSSGVIVWSVDLDGQTIAEPKPRKVGVTMSLSNCGYVFTDDSFISADPPGSPSDWKWLNAQPWKPDDFSKELGGNQRNQQ